MWKWLLELWNKIRSIFKEFRSRDAELSRDFITELAQEEKRQEALLARERKRNQDIEAAENTIRLLEESIKYNQEELNKLKAYVKTLGSRLQNPNFLESGKFSPQWKVSGNVYWYQLPNQKIIASYISGTVTFTNFDLEEFNYQRNMTR